MSFSVKEKLPGNYFQEVMDAQTEMVRMYIDDLDNPLIFSPYCDYNKLYKQYIQNVIFCQREITWELLPRSNGCSDRNGKDVHR